MYLSLRPTSSITSLTSMKAATWPHLSGFRVEEVKKGPDSSKNKFFAPEMQRGRLEWTWKTTLIDGN